jgi:Ni,Fe-hydrogenase III large subunit
VNGPAGGAPREGAEARMARLPFRWTRNLELVGLSEIPVLPIEDFHAACAGAVLGGGRLSALTILGPTSSTPRASEEILAVLSDDAGSRIGLVRTPVPPSRRYDALSATLPQAQAFERSILEEHGIVPEGHPWPKPLRRHAAGDREAATSFFRVEGSGVHEVAVGPVHAGIIEPGHFRFQCHGEKVLHLEIQLGYQHRGAEELFLRAGPALRSVLVESIAGDTAVGHALAHAGAMECLGGLDAPLEAQSLRGIALELERIANHAGDLGALCGDVGFLPGAAWLGRLRGEFLNMLLEISGNRFGRSLVIPGGVRFAAAGILRDGLLERLDPLERDFAEVSEIVLETTSVVSRFEQSGILTREAAEELGVVGPPARASGCDRDVRRDHPSGIYRFAHVPVALQDAGDVMARAVLRRTEVHRSIQFVRDHLREMRGGPLRVPPASARPDACVVSLVEGWRGEIAHLALTDPGGTLAQYRVVDPSIHNWPALAMVMRERQISDFPLCNKSFNLSYAGHDL